ncbi:hypothetical protein DFA_09835 [Cavenderia fasciculata]|uniref:Uncharacterized protein n=1 Tax=Cavenderia fasciculata TaxID=261658 RepID=F4QAV5_CACFS|nr:uncharacterized protein DFA_09835 [Cavenderia fasciculata]EGG15014.1 hypothetical protein DFA_09835 [Cavenderia fasciculata]|eukprot:XP_004351734.1 hypothetical protein DFA_09835 [Cavenderia fasciculata]
MSASDDQIKEAFEVFLGSFPTGTVVATSQIGPLMRSLGTNPSDAQIKEMEKKIGTPQFDLATFKIIYKGFKPLSAGDSVKDYTAQLKALAKDGIISESDIYKVMGTNSDIDL